MYYDCGDWSGVDNNPNTNLHKHYYGFKKSVKRNRAYMLKPENFGLPADAVLSRGFPHHDIAWQSVNIRGLTYTMHHHGMEYTNDSKSVDYTNDYLKYRTHNSGLEQIITLDGKPTSTVAISDTCLKTTTEFGWHNYNKDEYGTYIKTISKTLPNHEMWGIPTDDINVTLVNYSGYMILTVPTPAGVTGIKIFAESENGTTVYEKHAYCLKLNTSEDFKTCDLVEYEYHNFTGISPFGTDTYLLPYEPNYTINVTLHTPFEMIDAIINTTETDAEPVDTTLDWAGVWNMLYLFVPLGLIYWLVGLI